MNYLKRLTISTLTLLLVIVLPLSIGVWFGMSCEEWFEKAEPVPQVEEVAFTVSESVETIQNQPVKEIETTPRKNFFDNNEPISSHK